MRGGNETSNETSRPDWAQRIRQERLARGWSQRDAVRAMQAHCGQRLASEEALLRTWKRWESADSEPDSFNKQLIAKTFGTVTAAIFTLPRRRDAGVLAASGMDTLEIVSRLRVSDVNASTLDALAIRKDQLCSEYPHLPAEQLRSEGQEWLNRMTALLEGRLTLSQHREVVALAGYLALLVGCVEYDMGAKMAAESSRKAALTLGQEADNSEIIGWAHEMQAWYCLTLGDYQGAILASNAGEAAAPQHAVTVQLSAQRAKAWARLGDRRQVELALEKGRWLLESMPRPENLDHHFVVDPAKFDFYAMDCYRRLGEKQLAHNYAEQVLRAGTDFDGTELSPMRNAEARVTLGVVAARQGDVDLATREGRRALVGDRKSLPSLALASRELAHLLTEQFADAPATAEYLDQLRSVMATLGTCDDGRSPPSPGRGVGELDADFS